MENSKAEKIIRFIRGDGELLKDETAMEGLPEWVAEVFAAGQAEMAEGMIDRLGEGLLSENRIFQPQILKALICIGEDLLEAGMTGISLRLSHKLVVWIILETDPDVAYERICHQLQQIAQHLIAQGRFSHSNHILETFYIIYDGRLNKKETLCNLCGQILDNIARSPGVMDALLSEFRDNENNSRKEAIDTLVYLGNASTGQLLEMLKESNCRNERNRILQVLSYIGKHGSTQLTGSLKEEEPWYFLRNLILLLGRTGDPKHMETLRPLLRYRDLRVRRETLYSIRKLGGKGAEDIVLDLLTDADERLKWDVIKVLGEIGTEKSVSPLVALLKAVTNAPSVVDSDVAEELCKSLGRIGSIDGLPVLNQILDTYDRGMEGIEYNERVRAAAAGAIILINEKNKHLLKDINQRKGLMNIWSDLQDMLSREAFKALTDLFHEIRFGKEHLIYKQGTINRHLYFIQEGKLVFAYDQEGEEIWVKTLHSGDIAGIESFFSDTVTTTALRSVTSSRLQFIEKADFEALTEKFPELAKALHEYSQQRGNVLEVIQEYGMNRRVHTRAVITAKVSVQFMDIPGEVFEKEYKGKRLRGNLQDISAGGIAFLVNLSESIRHPLVGGNFNVKMVLPINGRDYEMDQDGTVVAVFHREGSTCSVHGKFFEQLNGLPDLNKVKSSPEPASEESKKDEFLVTRLPG